MAPRKTAGRKPAKNETAAGLINALTFLSALKPPTGQARQPYMDHVFLNGGWAIGFDGILAMGHPIEDGISGYVNTKLFLDALSNTDKSFSLSVTNAGHFHIQSGKYEALVPSMDPTTVPQTFPDANLYPFVDGPGFVTGAEAAAKVVSDNAESVLYASIRLNGQTVMATDGATVIEAYHGNNMPVGVVVPKVFVTAMAKTGKAPVGFGLAANWQTFTVHFADGSWLRTNCYDPASWSPEVLERFVGFFVGVTPEALEPKLFPAVNAVLPFADDDNRVIIRPGLVRTHPDKAMGAHLEVAEINFSVDLNGKRLLAVQDHATSFQVKNIDDRNGPLFVFFGGQVRGVIMGLAPLPEPAPAVPASGGWGSPQVAAAGGWGAPAAPAGAAPVEWSGASPAQNVAPPADPAPQGWNGIPATGLAGDPEYEAGRADATISAGGSAVLTSGPAPERTADDVDMTSDFNIGGWLTQQQGTDVGE